MTNPVVIQLQTIRAQTLATIEELTLHPKPTYSLDGQQVAWGTYLQQLQSTVKWCDTQIAYEEPFEIRTTAIT